MSGAMAQVGLVLSVMAVVGPGCGLPGSSEYWALRRTMTGMGITCSGIIIIILCDLSRVPNCILLRIFVPLSSAYIGKSIKTIHLYMYKMKEFAI